MAARLVIPILLVGGASSSPSSLGGLRDSWIEASASSVSNGDRVEVSWHLSDDAAAALTDEVGDEQHIEEVCETEPEDGGAIKTECRINVPKSCWVGEFTPAGSDLSALGVPPTLGHSEWAIPLTTTAPAKWVPCGALFSEGRWIASKAGFGSFNFTVTNRRQTFEYALFDGGFLKPNLLARTGAIAFDDASMPMHRHIARGEDVDSMRVSWNSAQSADAFSSSSDGHRVQFGTASGVLDSELVAQTSTYSADDLCGSPATDVGFVDPGYFHSALLTSLVPGETVYYRVGSDEFGWTEETSFVAFDGSRKETRMLLTADMGIGYDDHSLYHWPTPRALATARHLISEGTSGSLDGEGDITADLALHIGDIAYGTGYGAKWDRFMEQMEPLAKRIPYMTNMGNHERDWPDSGVTGPFAGVADSGGECGVPTNARFQMPVGSDVTQTQGWYSFNDGPVHVVMLTTEWDLFEGSDQHAWLEADLDAVDRKVTPWVIVTGHRQLYSCAKRNKDIADAIEPLLLAKRVDLVVVGHIHLAQRTCPIFNGTCVDEADEHGFKAPVHAIVGHAGMTVSACTAERFGPWGWGSLQHGYATLEANLTDMRVKFYADCEGGPTEDWTHPADCGKDGSSPLLHTYEAAMPYPRGY